MARALEDELASGTCCTSKQIHKVARATWALEKNKTVHFVGSEEIF